MFPLDGLEIRCHESHRFVDDVTCAMNAHVVVAGIPVDRAFDRFALFDSTFNRAFVDDLVTLHPDVFDRRGAVFAFDSPFIRRLTATLRVEDRLIKHYLPPAPLFDARHHPSRTLLLVAVS